MIPTIVFLFHLHFYSFAQPEYTGGITSIHSFNINESRKEFFFEVGFQDPGDIRNNFIFRANSTLPLHFYQKVNVEAVSSNVTPSITQVGLERISSMHHLRFGGRTDLKRSFGDKNTIYLGLLTGIQLVTYKGIYDNYNHNDYHGQFTVGRQEKYDLTTGGILGITYELSEYATFIIDFTFDFNYIQTLEYIADPGIYKYYSDYFNLISATQLNVNVGLRF